jgi:hypothetical protein
VKFQVGQLVRNRRSLLNPDWDLPWSKGIIVDIERGLSSPLRVMLKIQWFDDNAHSSWFPATRVVPLSE